MRWDRLFEDLEGQLASEWEAERAALDSEAERLRLSRLTLRERLGILAAEGATATIAVDDESLSVQMAGLGADWLAAEPTAGRGELIVPLAAISGIGIAHADLLRSARPAAGSNPVMERMTFGFVLRDAARRRQSVHVRLRGGASAAGTIDRAGSDHLDLALHEPGTPRRATEVTGFRMIPLSAVRWVRFDDVPPTRA